MDLDGARRIGFHVEQSFRYAYRAPVTALAQRLVVVPGAATATSTGAATAWRSSGRRTPGGRGSTRPATRSCA